MSHLETAVNYTKRIESLLVERYGATGKGLHEKLTSVESSIPSPICKKIRYISSVRNKLVHEASYVPDDLSGFERSCELVLEALAPEKIIRPDVQSAPAKAQPVNRISHINTPIEIAESAYIDQPGFDLFAVRLLLNLTHFSLYGYVKYLIWTIYPAFFIWPHENPSQTHWYWFLIATTSLLILCHGLEAWMTVPRAKTGFPLIRANRFGSLISKMAWHTIAYGTVISIYANINALQWTAYVVLAIAFGVGALIFAWISPAWGYVNYSQADEDADLAWVAEQKAKKQALQSVPAVTNTEDYATPVNATQPKINFSHIFGMQAIKTKLLEPAQLIVAERKVQTGVAKGDRIEAPANGILLHGEPGNGKTVFAEALAGELNVPLVQLTYGDISSKWLGEMPRVITNCFAYAKAHAPCVLFVDEIDSFIRSRDSGSNNGDELKVTNTLLTEIVNLREHRVVLMGATNYLANLDAAAIREGRFDYKVEITPPDEVARIGILQKGVSKHAQHLNVDPAVVLSVAKRWNGFSVSRLLAVVKALPRYAKDNNLQDIGHNEWMATLREVQGRNGRVPANTTGLNELVLDAATREALTLVGSRLKDVERIESLGGTLPSGVLFHGPSGTGKTAAARALAKEVGWAFLSVAGPDLLADREKISKLYAEAKDIRPTIIFIDEADDVLRNRQYSSTPDLTNRLLVLMDGTEEKVKDVVFIAATNHPDQIDPALLRTGRFTEKVEFMPPPADQIPRFVSSWLKGKKVMLDAGLDAWEIAGILEGQTIASIEGVLQYALNRAINQHQAGQALVLQMVDLQAGCRVILGEEQPTA